MSSDTTRWPLLEERAPFATASRSHLRKRPRPVWLLTALAFLCGGLVSAAAFSIGWKHQAQRDTAARSALAAATARTHRLDDKVSALQTSLAEARSSTARATAAERALALAAAKVGNDAQATGGDTPSISSGAATVTGSATRIAGELKTLNSYLTTTPTGQLDPGYISSQTAYLAQQLTRLEGDAGNLGTPLASLEAALRKLSRDANALKTRSN
jgi:septal ring factor EnvC (AmiA/AmiB activator)